MKKKHLSHDRCHVVPTVDPPNDQESIVNRTDTLPVYNQSVTSHGVGNLLKPEFKMRPNAAESGRESGGAILLQDHGSSSNAATSRVSFPLQIEQYRPFTKRTGEDSVISSKEKAIYDNKFDMLDQYSRLGSSNRMPTTHLHSSKQSQMSDDRSPSGLRKLQQREESKGQQGVTVGALQDLNEVLDVKVNKAFDKLNQPHRKTSSREKPLVGRNNAISKNNGGEKSQATSSKENTERQNKVHQCTLPDVRKRLKSQQKTRRALISNQQSVCVTHADNAITLIGGGGATFYGSTSSQVKTLERAVTAGSAGKQAKRPQTKQKSQNRYPAIKIDKKTPNSSSVNISQRKGVVDLNMQIIQSDQSGVFRQLHQKSPSSRQLRIPLAGSKHARPALSGLIKVQIETKGKGRKKKSQEDLFIGVGVFTSKTQARVLAPAEFKPPESGVATLAEPSVVHSAKINDRGDIDQNQNSVGMSAKGWEADNDNNSNSSFQTLGMPNSYVRTAKHLSQFKEEDVYSNHSPLKTIKISEGASNNLAAEKQHMGVPSDRIPDFVVKSFVNTIKSRAQRDAKRAHPQNQNPYFSQQSINRVQECSIIINPFDNQPVYGSNVKKSSLSSQPLPHGQVSVKSDSSSQEPVSSQGIDPKSPPQLNNQVSVGRDSELKLSHSWFQKGKYSTQNRLSSVGSEVDGKVEMVTNSDKHLFGQTDVELPKKEITVQETSIRFDHEDSTTTRIMEQTMQNEYYQPVEPETFIYAAAKVPTVMEIPDIRLKFKLDQNVARERQKILARKLQVEKNLEETQSLVELPAQRLGSQNVFNVQNVKLFPRNEKTSPNTQNRAQTAQSSNIIQRLVHKEERSSTRLSSHIQIKEFQARKNRKTLSVSYLRRYQQNRQNRKFKIQTPLQQSDISIEPTRQMILMQKNPKHSATAKRQLQAAQHAYGDQVGEESIIRWQGDTSTDMQSEEDSLKNHHTTIKRNQEESTHHQVSIHNSSVRTMSQDETLQQRDPQVHFSQELIKGHERRSQLELYANKSFKVRKHHGKQKSMMYLKSCIPTVSQQNQFRESLISSNHEHHKSKCNCQKGSTISKKWGSIDAQNNTSNGNSRVRRASERHYQQDQVVSQENMIDYQNPYQMSEEELERLKDKNRSLISQFKNMRDANAELEQDAVMSAFHKGRFSIHSNENRSTLKSVGKKSSAVNTSLISRAGDTGKLVKENGSTPSKLNDDIKLFMKEKPIDSLHSNDDDLGSPHIYQPIQQPIASSRKNRDEFETAQLSSTYRDNIEQIAGLPLDKARPASSHESTAKSNKQRIEKRKSKDVRGIMTKVIGQNIPQKKNSSAKKRIYESAGSRTSKLKSKEQFMQTLSLLEPSKFKGRMMKSTDKLKLSKSRENLRTQQRLSSNYDQEEIIVGVVRDQMSGSEQPVALQSRKQSVQVQADEVQNLEPVIDTQKVLSMTPQEINDLNFKQVCKAQQALYSSLTHLQGILGNIFIEKQRKGSQNPLTMSSKRAQSPNSIFPRSVESLKKHIYTTSYKSSWQPSLTRDISTPFSREQQQLRLNYKQMQGTKIDPLLMQAPSQDAAKIPKIRLTDESPREAAKGTVQAEVDNFNKFKRRQQRAIRKRQRLEQQEKILEQCTPEEFALLTQICFLMRKQDMLVEKAKEITTQEFFDNPTNQSIDFEEQLDLFETRKQSLQKFSYKEIFENKLMPVAQKMSSRQSLRKQVHTHDSKDLIVAATDKLAVINRVQSGRTTNESPLRPRFTSNHNLSREVGLREGAGSFSYSRQKSGESGRLKTQDALQFTNPNETVMTNLSIQLNNEKLGLGQQEANQISALQNIGKANSVASTINLYMQKFSGSVAGVLENPKISIQSPDRPDLSQSKLTSINNPITEEKLNLTNFQSVVAANNFIVGQKSITNKSTVERGEPTGRFMTQEDVLQRKELSKVHVGQSQTIGEQIINLDEKAFNHSLHETESPLDKFNLVYKNQGGSSSTQFKMSPTKKVGQILQSSSARTFGNKSSNQSNSNSKSQRSGGFQQVTTKEIKSSTLSLLGGSKSLNLDI